MNEKTTWELRSTLTPAQVIAVIVDFGPDRPRIWPETSHADVYRIHALGATWADVTEGVPFAWSRERYDWTRPGVVTLEQVESNVALPGGSISYKITEAPGGSRIVCVRDRRFRSTPRGIMAGTVMRAFGPWLLRRPFAGSLRRIDVAGAAP